MIDITGAGLDSSGTPDRFPSISSDSKECSRKTGNSKTNVVVVVVGIVVVAISRTTVVGIVDPRTTPQLFGNLPH
jgi:hypothetical protein